MGVIHHANYLKYFEEARVAWMREKGLIKEHFPYTDVCFAVLETKCKHLKGIKFDEEILIGVIVKQERLKIRFRYAIYLLSNGDRAALGETLLVPVDAQLKPYRLDKKIATVMENEPWIETWPWNLSELQNLQL